MDASLENGDPRAEIREILERHIPLAATLGIRCEDAGSGHVRLRMPASGVAGNHVGTVYAGASFTLAEVGAGALLRLSLPKDLFPVLVAAEIRYQRPAFGDVIFDETVEPDAVEGWLSSHRRDSRSVVDVPVSCSSDDKAILAATFSYRIFEVPKEVAEEAASARSTPAS